MAEKSIKIKTEIQTKQAEISLTTLENKMAKTAQKAAELKESMAKMEGVKVNTAEYEEISKQIEKATIKFGELREKEAQMISEGKQGSTAFNALEEKIEELGNEIRYAERELQDLVDTGKAFKLGEETDEYKKKATQLQALEAEMDIQNQKHDVLMLKQKKVSEGYKELGDKGKEAFEKVNKASTKSGSAMSKFAGRVKAMLASMFIFNTISKMLRSITSAFSEGFSNMASNFAPFKAQVEGLQASLLTLKNSLAAAFYPIVSTIIPYIQRLVEWLTTAVNAIGQFIGALMGKTSYVKAVKQVAGSTDKATKATKDNAEAYEEAEKAAEGYLSPIDEINKFNKEDNSKMPNIKTPNADTGSGGGGGLMFEEIPIDNKILDYVDRLKEKLKEIWDIFKGGFFDGLGDWESRWNRIKEAVGNIKDVLKEIWNDPDVKNGASKWFESFINMLGTWTGAIASIGLTIATNLVGGLEKYLLQNKDRIKGYLISMFDIWTEINDQLSEYFKTFAYIFEAFASEDGQQLTANLIGIFADAFMGVTELASKFGRDVLKLITDPIINNADGLRTALEKALGIFAIVTGTIKKSVDETMAKVNEMYDQHIKPVMDKITQSVSDMVGRIVEWWNTTLAPILQYVAEGLDDTWTNYVQPIINEVIEIIGLLADLVGVLWDEVIAPFFDGVMTAIEILSPVLENIWNQVKTIVDNVMIVIGDLLTFIKDFVKLVSDIIQGDWSAVWEDCKNIVSDALDIVFDIITGILNALIGSVTEFVNAVITTVTNFFTKLKESHRKSNDETKKESQSFFSWLSQNYKTCLSDLKKIWDEKWGEFSSKIEEVWGKIKDTVSEAIQWIEDLIAGAMDKINSLKEKISSLKSSFGSSSSIGSGFSFSMPSFNLKLPKFATGGVIPTGVGQHLAMVGDNKYETEVVSPLSTIKEALVEALNSANMSGNNTTLVKLYLDGNQIAESVVNAGKVRQMSTGENMFAI